MIYRLADGRPVPPPKPSHYQLTKPPWVNENEVPEPGFNHVQPNMPINSNGISYSAVYPQPKRASNSNGNLDLSNGPSPYYPVISGKDQPPNIPAPSIPSRDLQNSYANQNSTFGSPIKR